MKLKIVGSEERQKFFNLQENEKYFGFQFLECSMQFKLFSLHYTD